MTLRANFLHGVIAAIAVQASLATASAEPAMWVIRDEDSTIYLLGTIHVLRPDTAWQTPKIKNAVAESTELWTEIAGGETDMAALIGKYGFSPKKPLSRRLQPKQKERIWKMAKEYGFPTKLLEPMKPWYAALTWTMLPIYKAGYNPQAGVEAFLTTQARFEGDKLAGFETLEEQIEIMNGLPEAEQIKYLMETLADVEKGLAELEKLIGAWAEGDTDHLAKEFVEEMARDAPSLYKRMFVDRNTRWSQQIAEMLKGSGVQFVAVGAGHLVGPDSVQELLRQQGIKAERY